MRILARTDGLTPEQFTALRDRFDKTGIGGSDMAKVMGLHPFEDGFTLHFKKLGRVEQEDISTVEAVRWGRWLEPAIRQGFEEDTGLRVECVNAILGHDTEPWMFGTPDGKIAGKNEGFEAKNVGPNPLYAGWWDEGPPNYVKIQCYHYLEITGWERWHVAALFTGNHLGLYIVERDEAYQSVIVAVGREFIRRLLAGEDPPTDGSESCADTIKKLFKGGDKDVVALPDEAGAAIEAYLEGHAAEKKAVMAKLAAKNWLKNELQNHDVGRYSTERRTWHIRRKPFSVKEDKEGM